MLGNGGTATVYLATHLGLEEKRAIKVISRESAEYGRFRKEGLILKSVRHPGIPIVYDLEEDGESGYLIEEYLEGENLFEVVKEQGPLSTARTVSIGIQICHLVHHLHSAKENPILYLDLQPKNLLLCRGTVKLVDFGQAAFFGESGEAAGTPGCAAPEQYAGEQPDERTDIYGIGAVLYFLCEGRYFSPDGLSAFGRFPSSLRRLGKEDRRRRKLRGVIRRCLERRREKRYRTAMELAKELEKVGTLFPELPGRGSGGESFPIVVGFAGSGRGVGTTHLAVGMAAYLRDRNVSVLYAEENGEGAVRELLRHFRKNLSRFGTISLFGLDMRPFLGENVHLDQGDWQVVVKDLGTDGWERDREWDFLVEVRGGKVWNRPRGALPSPTLVVLNQNCSSARSAGLDKGEDTVFCRAPYFPDPFFPDRLGQEFYGRVCGVCGIEERSGGRWAEKRRKLRHAVKL
ncbi:MAG TPA: serine/threonine protein kinase [Candidatus Lachnoclostridium stercorigallinarum]|uniref:non-specific serine/threonine protein kinase n=1 Tax=Candidatus Lachnoclostridium stercorigallinarum TaxID=2838634 RepID=A0A9D2GG37_9FIRM|nr:serine/threonine protein kinase [Candidatus Lachnoclostridium stercorigallinarum]